MRDEWGDDRNFAQGHPPKLNGMNAELGVFTFILLLRSLRCNVFT